MSEISTGRYRRLDKHGAGADQAALHGLIQKTRDLGLPLISVNHVGPGHPQPPAEAR